MSKGYRIFFETYDLNNPSNVIDKSLLFEEKIIAPNNCLDFSLEQEDQIAILQASLDKIISEKVKLINKDIKSCPKCSGKVIRLGKQPSKFHDLFTDHDVSIQRVKCLDCKWEPASTVSTLINTSLSGSLAKKQAELGALYTFREAESILDSFSSSERSINNRNRIKLIAGRVEEGIKHVDDFEKKLIEVPEAKELIINVDGGHVKTTEDQRSIEAMTSVIYRPEALEINEKGTRNYLSDKSCAASAKDDSQTEIINNTIIAAIRQGLTKNTKITALCDGADNCWNVVESLRPLCNKMTCILDWFHISMKMNNIALPKDLKSKFIRVKWHLWRGNHQNAVIRLDQLIESTTKEALSNKLRKFKNYILNNADKIVNYSLRKKEGNVFTSNLAEATVESLINRRCKGKQHMRWSREGLNPILQLRAKIHTNEWKHKWRSIMLNSPI